MIRFAAIALCCVATSSCANVDSQTQEQAPARAPATTQAQPYKSDIAAMGQRIDALTKEVEDLRKRQAQDEWTRFMDELKGVVYLRPGDDGYSVIHYDLGVLTVRLDDVSPYANGAKVRLRFGNPLASTVNGLRCTIEWGQVDENGSSIASTTKSKELSLSEEMRSGAWTDVQVVLESIPPEQLGFVRVKEITHSGIRLRQ